MSLTIVTAAVFPTTSSMWLVLIAVMPPATEVLVRSDRVIT